MCRDRASSDDLPLTQEFLSVMLGANRTTVTMSAITLQDQGFIEYSRGHIRLTNRPGLEAFSCDCYQMIGQEFNRLFK